MRLSPSLSLYKINQIFMQKSFNLVDQFDFVFYVFESGKDVLQTHFRGKSFPGGVSPPRETRRVANARQDQSVVKTGGSRVALQHEAVQLCFCCTRWNEPSWLLTGSFASSNNTHTHTHARTRARTHARAAETAALDSTCQPYSNITNPSHRHPVSIRRHPNYSRASLLHMIPQPFPLYEPSTRENKISTFKPANYDSETRTCMEYSFRNIVPIRARIRTIFSFLIVTEGSY